MRKAREEGKNLEDVFEVEEEEEGEEEEDECVICAGDMEGEVVIFHCGHEFCGRCVKSILRAGSLVL